MINRIHSPNYILLLLQTTSKKMYAIIIPLLIIFRDGGLILTCGDFTVLILKL